MAITTPTEDHGPELEATDARQGRWGRHMFWVLAVSLVLAFAALFGTWAFRSNDLQAVDDRAAQVEAPSTPVAAGPIN